MQPDSSPSPVGERPERGVEEPEGKRPPNTGARLWGRVRSKLLRQKVTLRVCGEGDGWGGRWLCNGFAMSPGSSVCGGCSFLAGGFVGCRGLWYGGGAKFVGSVRGARRSFGCFGSSLKQLAACGVLVSLFPSPSVRCGTGGPEPFVSGHPAE